ncbi:MAG: tRNA 4-thiouridine(8) synthase ThiI [Candidatus Omnitrophota bacterium]|nr:MAG: tRNA 4-thiouridine(8) synthase ThiI [Candidatus Omnitrophota bacterium]
MKKIKAISLLSAGLDSILATKLILDQGIEVEAVNFKTAFSDSVAPSKIAADKLGIGLKIFNIGEEYFQILKNPKYGYGSNVNPCLDCRIFIFKKAARYMKETKTSFLITGEVLEERPMSQRRDALRIIERDSKLEGLVLRPLSAKLLEPTIAEKEGLVDREKLFAIRGRSRKPQIQLARQFGIDYYLSPAGGCLLTDPGFTNRMRDLMRQNGNFTINDIELLKVGRHFRLNPGTKLIVGRNRNENNRLLNMAKGGDLLFNPTETAGPVGIVRGEFAKEIPPVASSIVARYSDSDGNQRLEIAYKRIPDSTVSSILVFPAGEEKLQNMRI